MFIFSRPAPNTQSTEKWALELVCGADLGRNLRCVSSRSPSQDSGAENRPRARGRIYHLIFPKVCPVSVCQDTVCELLEQVWILAGGSMSFRTFSVAPPAGHIKEYILRRHAVGVSEASISLYPVRSTTRGNRLHGDQGKPSPEAPRTREDNEEKAKRYENINFYIQPDSHYEWCSMLPRRSLAAGPSLTIACCQELAGTRSSPRNSFKIGLRG
jgi:hypothetical protein